jgi:hypothetical protein
MRRTRLLAILLAGSTALAVPAVAKEGVRAKLDAPVRLDAAPGTTIRVLWHLVDENGRRFAPSGIYLRVSRCGRGPLRIPAGERGGRRYSARVRVPKGGIRRLVVGLKGWRIVGERRERADVLFPFDPPVRRRCA